MTALASPAGIGLGMTVGFDLAGESVRALALPGGWLTALGRMTGMIGTYALLLSVLIVGRLPVLERVIGQDRLVRWHRLLAPWSLVLLVVHAVLITLGYAQAAHDGALHETWVVVTSMIGMLGATVGLALLVAAAVTSVRIARSRMKYETWWVVHLYSYLALALSWSHQLATGAPFADHPFARSFWIATWLATAGVVLAYRVLLPIWRSLRHNVRVVAVREEGPGIVSIICEGRGLDRMPVSGGQFLQWRFLKPGLWWQAHPYSLSAVPSDRFMRVTVKDLGDHSRGLHSIAVGTRIAIEGPYGAFTKDAMVTPHALLVGAGVGSTPLRALLEDLPSSAHAVVMLRASTDDELVLADEIEALVNARGGHLYRLVGNRAQWPLDARQLAKLVPDIRSRDVFVCGPEGFMESLLDAAQRLSVPMRQLHHEDYAF
ncbi:MAG: ferric reductase-like transmembrane domain-containing protein [Thermoleophilia bacterium]|nr:ferric reductase-like transmembrane domain-containing protein [Thermoleophilia bacterium]